MNLRHFTVSKNGITDLKKVTIKNLSRFIMNENVSTVFYDVFTAMYNMIYS